MATGFRDDYMAILSISTARTALHSAIKAIKKAVGWKFGRQVKSQPQAERKMPAAEQVFGRKALSEFKVRTVQKPQVHISSNWDEDEADNTEPLLAGMKERLTFHEKRLQDMSSFTKSGFHRLLKKHSDKGTKLVRDELSEYHRMRKKGASVEQLEGKLLRIKSLASKYLDLGSEVQASGSVWLVKKEAMKDLIRATEFERFSFGLDKNSPDSMVKYFEHMLMEEPATSASYLLAMDLDKSMECLLQFEDKANTDSWPDNVEHARELAVLFIDGLDDQQCRQLLQKVNISVPESISMLRRKAVAAVTTYASGPLEGQQGNIKQAELLHNEYADGLLNMFSCRLRSLGVLRAINFQPEDRIKSEMLPAVSRDLVSDTCAFKSHPTMHLNLSDSSSYGKTGQILWMNSLLKVAENDQNFRDFMLLYDEIYHQGGAVWLEEIKMHTPPSRIKDIEHPDVMSVAEKITPELVLSVKNNTSQDARAGIYADLGWPWPVESQPGHPATPFIRALEKRYPAG